MLIHSFNNETINYYNAELPEGHILERDAYMFLMAIPQTATLIERLLDKLGGAKVQLTLQVEFEKEDKLTTTSFHSCLSPILNIKTRLWTLLLKWKIMLWAKLLRAMQDIYVRNQAGPIKDA